jgi:hypothetical protein
MPPPPPPELQTTQQASASFNPTYQPFVCDEALTGQGAASFVSSLKHFSLQLSVGDSPSVIVGAVFGGVAGVAPDEIVIDFKGQANTTFGPYLLLSYTLPNGKVAGRVLPFVQGKPGAGATGGFTRVVFRGADMGLPSGTTIRSMEIIALGENGGGNVTIGDITIDGVTCSKTLASLSTCEYVP